jgi:hypothetical protein
VGWQLDHTLAVRLPLTIQRYLDRPEPRGASQRRSARRNRNNLSARGFAWLMPPGRESVQIDKGGSGMGVFGA